MKNAIYVYGKYVSMHVKSAMEHKVSFFLNCLGQFLTSFNVFLGVYFMLQRFHSVEGFTFEEVLLCYGVVLMSFSLSEAFARGFDSFAGLIRKGEFDRIMVRPRNEIFQVLGSRIEFSRIGRILQAAVMLGYGMVKSPVSWNIYKMIVVFLMILGGVCVFFGIYLIYAAICFFSTEGLEVMNIFTDGVREYGKYPLSIYGKRVLTIVTFVIPYGLAWYYPMLYLFGRGSFLYGLFPVPASLFIIPCLGAWKFGLKRYRSTGS